MDIPHSSNQLRQVREDKLKKIQAITGEAYPRKVHTTHALVEFIKEYFNSDEFKDGFTISEYIQIEDVNY